MSHAPFIKYFSRIKKLQEEEIAFLEKVIPLIHLSKDAFLLKEQEVSRAFYFLINGCARMFYLVDGMEKTTFFYEEGTFVSSYDSFTKQLPSKHYIQVLEDSSLARFDFEIVQLILEKYPAFDFLARAVMEDELSTYQEMLASFVTMNAEQRYQRLLTERPGLVRRVPQYHLATYLGVSPETLSRIRKRISLKGSDILDNRQ